MTEWICDDCGNVVEGETPPEGWRTGPWDTCPECNDQALLEAIDTLKAHGLVYTDDSGQTWVKATEIHEIATEENEVPNG